MDKSINYGAKTFFMTIWPKSLENMGIEPDFTDPVKLGSDVAKVFRDEGVSFYGSVCSKPKKDDSSDLGFHVHAAVSFSKSKRVKSVSKLFGNSHIEPMRGSKEEAADYIEKIGKFEEKGELILALFGSRDNIRDNSGQRLDLDSFDKAVQNGDITASNLDQYIFDHCITERASKELSERFRRIKKLSVPRWRDLAVIYVEGPSGSGKTRGAYDRYYDMFKASVSEKTSFPFNGYMGESVLLLDELRPGVFKPAELFQILDGYPLTVDIKGSSFPACWTTVIISTAFKLDDWFANSDDNFGQDNNRTQFLRRISEHYFACDGRWIRIKDLPIDKNNFDKAIKEDVKNEKE